MWIEVSEAAVRPPSMTRISNLSLRIEADPKAVRILDLKGELGASPFTAAARAESRDGRWSDLSAIAVHGSVFGKQVLLANTPELKVRGDVDLSVEGTAASMRVFGNVAITTGRYARRITALPGMDSVRARGGSGRQGIALRLVEEPFGQCIALDIAVSTVRPFQVRTNAFDSDLTADLRLLGNASLAHFSGAVSSARGTIRLPGSTLSMRSLLLSFTEQRPFDPEILVTAEGRRHGYRVQLTARGPLGEPEVLLSSTPALPAEDLIVLLTTGALPQRLAEQDARGQAALVGAYLAQELASWYLRDESTEESESFFDRFSVEIGREISERGLETVLVEFRLTDHLSLQAERDVYEDFNGGLSLRFRFR